MTFNPGSPTPQTVPEPEPYCDIHSVLAAVCGGPHYVVHTDVGYEVLAPGEAPVGIPTEH